MLLVTAATLDADSARKFSARIDKAALTAIAGLGFISVAAIRYPAPD
jgi:hypothetical protein